MGIYVYCSHCGASFKGGQDLTDHVGLRPQDVTERRAFMERVRVAAQAGRGLKSFWEEEEALDCTIGETYREA